MEIKSPKEMVADVAGHKDERNLSLFAMKSRSTMSGAFYGGASGFLIAMWKGRNMYAYTLVGALAGGLISNILTIKR